ncbi:hypothetical protein QL285_089763 [Trifolium repens]|jgi:hypothetical protein|nr:hypothetical protein QL285_089763 [Trifolium repens]
MFLCSNGCVLHFERFCTGEVHCPTVAIIPRQGILVYKESRIHVCLPMGIFVFINNRVSTIKYRSTKLKSSIDYKGLHCPNNLSATYVAVAPDSCAL